MNARIGLGQLRNSAAYYFDRVAAGESFDVVRRGRMVAKIVPPSDAGLALEASVEPCLREVPLAAEDPSDERFVGAGRVGAVGMSDEKDDSTMPECTASTHREAHGRATNRYPAPESRK